MTNAYGVFKVVDHVMRRPKRKIADGSDEAMREYTVLECPHCKHKIEIATPGMRNNKAAVIREHIANCKSFTGQRPVKQVKMVIKNMQPTTLTTVRDTMLTYTVHTSNTSSLQPKILSTTMLPSATLSKELHEMQLLLKSKEVEGKKELIEFYKKQVDLKEVELAQIKREKEKTDIRLVEALHNITKISSRAERLQTQYDTLKSKYDAEMNIKSQIAKANGRYGQLNKLHNEQKRVLEMEAQTAAAVAFEKGWARTKGH